MFIAGRHDTVLDLRFAPPPRQLLLLLDNRDSFVWNLAQALEGLGAPVRVVRSDAIDVEQAGSCRAIVLSPGPGRPEQAGNCVDVIRRWSGHVPILGVCLGHQAIGFAFGALVDRGPPVHGRTTAILHDGTGIFHGLPSPFPACRYHSLYVARELPAMLVATAHAAGGEVMALRHREHATFGVQFHPESFRTPLGPRLLANFLREVA